MDNFFTKDENAIVTSNRLLYTPSGFARASLLYLQEIGSLTAQKPHTSTRSGLSSYLFFMVLSGSGKLSYGSAEYSLREGDCVFIDCNRFRYSHSTDANDLWTLSWMHFNGNSMSSIYAKYLERGGRPVFHPENLSEFEKLHRSVFEMASSDDYVRDMRINQTLSALLTAIMEQSWNPDHSSSVKKKRDVSAVKEHLDRHYAEKISLDELAEQFFINKFYLTRIFKEQFGSSINSYLLQIRITHAKQLLRFSDEKIESIGINCGLGALTYFSRTFRKTENMSPSEYRDQWRGNGTV